MSLDQISMQIVAINDAIQILARSNTTVMAHSKDIDGLLQKTTKNDERLREIESLIHQSCELKSKEIASTAKEVDDKIGKVYDKAFQYAWQFSAVVGSIGVGMFYYLSSSIDSNVAIHSAFEKQQDDKADKIFTELFNVMREIRKDMSDMKSDMAVIKSEQKHYNTRLTTHMQDEVDNWRKK